MTFEQRMAELGVDLSDLPTRYEVEHRSAAFEAADNFGGSLSMTHNFTDYILHLTDIIDRMETRLVNVTGERDWLKDVVTTLNVCETCGASGKACDSCWPHYEYSGVPEDWRPDE
jgi:hypothetical protein